MDPETGKIGAAGLAKFLSDLELRWISRDFLIIAWKFKCQQWFEYRPTLPGEFCRADFYGGMLDFYCDSVEKLKAELDFLPNWIYDPDKGSLHLKKPLFCDKCQTSSDPPPFV